LVEYCQVPLVSSTPMTAMPSTAPTSTSVTPTMGRALAMMADTASPAGLVSSSLMSVSVMLPVLSSSGASLTAPTVILAVSVRVLNAVVPPLGTVSTMDATTPVLWSQAR